MEGSGGPLLTEQEAAIYDRQIRVWGVEAQKRLSKARVLLINITGAVAEAAKNAVLAGVGSVTLVDDTPVTPEAATANFLIPPEALEGPPQTLANVCAHALKEFNAMVSVDTASGKVILAEDHVGRHWGEPRPVPGRLEDLPDSLFGATDVVVLGRAKLSHLKRVNAKRRALSESPGFFAVDCRGSCGWIVADLGPAHSYRDQRKEKEREAPLQACFPSLEGALAVPWSKYPKRAPPLLTALRVVQTFEEKEGRQPGELSSGDAASLLALRDTMAKEQGVSGKMVANDGLLKRIADAGSTELPPVAAILGGILGQEIVRCVSAKGAPLNNMFLYDAYDGSGVVVQVS